MDAKRDHFLLWEFSCRERRRENFFNVSSTLSRNNVSTVEHHFVVERVFYECFKFILITKCTTKQGISKSRTVILTHQFVSESGDDYRNVSFEIFLKQIAICADQNKPVSNS